AGNPVAAKIYPGVGHFIHTDVPFEFAADTVSFIKTSAVDAVSPDVIDALVNGMAAPAAAAGGGGGGAPERPSGFSK
ncbi:hypothetical protein, partial [Amaricoccus sp.]|uniref:hypothetical protein n=1 Tax=Amaricoccus sp. TaxID=1872485 RepID=UPI0026117019